jgi:hypothetical protein
MTHLPTPKVSELIRRSIDTSERSYGATMPALAGLITRVLLTWHGVDEKENSWVTVKSHAHGARRTRSPTSRRPSRWTR